MILKPTDNAIVWVAVSHQAVAQANEWWPRNFSLGGRAVNVYGEGSMAHRDRTDALGHSDGVVIDGMVTRTR